MNHRTTLRKVMKAAWTIFRKGGVTFSQALVKAWAWVKQGPKMWLIDFAKVVGETEKAIKIVAPRYSGWIPKSVSEVTLGGNVFVAEWFAIKNKIS
jgi:hypothetical protein